MAITKIKSIKSTLKKALDYICDESKTDGKLLVDGYNCAPETAHFEFKMTEEMAKEIVGDYTKKSNNLAYHTIQSFDPRDNITPEDAHEIGKKLAEELTNGEHEYVIATHIDKGHIHNHIIFNAYNSETFKKFDCNKNTFRDIRAISDRLCEEKGLNVIKEPTGKGKCYKEYLEDQKGTSWKTLLKNTINKSIEVSKTFDDFIVAMQKEGYQIKRGKHIAFKAPGQQKFTRAKALGEQYTEQSIKGKINCKVAKKQITIAKKMILQETTTAYFTRIPYTKIYLWIDKENSNWTNDRKNTLLVNIEENKTYDFVDENNVKVNTITGNEIHKYYDDAANKSDKAVKLDSNDNTKHVEFTFDKQLEFENKINATLSVHQLAETLLILSRENINGYEEIDMKISQLKSKSTDIRSDIKNIEKKNQGYNKVAKYLVTYNKNLEFYVKYGNERTKFGGYKKYESEILLFKNAKEKLEQLGINPDVNIDKIIDVIKQQSSNITELKVDLNYVDSRIDSLILAYKNVDLVLNKQEIINDEKEQNKEQNKEYR